MKKILLIAPSQPGINSIPEIRAISEMHRTFVLNGNLTINDIYQAVRRSEYDIIHVATHTLEDNHFDKFPINATEMLTIDDLVQIGKLSKASLFFFNSCHSARSAYYIIKRLPTSAIYTTIEIEDAEAWKVPLSFYQVLSSAESGDKIINFKDIFDSIDDESGNYGFVTSISTQIDALSHLTHTVEELSLTVAELKTSVNKINTIADNNTAIVDGYIKSGQLMNSRWNKYYTVFFLVCLAIISANQAMYLFGFGK